MIVCDNFTSTNMKNKLNNNVITVETIIAQQKAMAAAVMKKHQDLMIDIERCRQVIPNYQSPLDIALESRRNVNPLVEKVFSVLSENASGRMGRSALAKACGVDGSKLQYILEKKNPIHNGFTLKKIYQPGDSWSSFIKVKTTA